MIGDVRFGRSTGSSCARFHALRLLVLACGATLAACSVDVEAPGLSAPALSGTAVGCVFLDSTDAVPDGIDENCNGYVDEASGFTHGPCPFGARVIFGTNHDDVLQGSSGRDCIFGYGGNDRIYGNGGDDVVFGGSGNDQIFVRGGVESVWAGDGADLVDTTGSLASTVYGEAGTDTLTGGTGVDVFYGGDDNDVLNGGGGRDTLNGGNCHDLLVGGASTDTGDGGRDFDACDTEQSRDCERNGSTRVLCHADSQCKTTERCAVSSGFCVPRTAATCGASSCSPSGPTDASCNGIDDDCDGIIDDDYVSTSTTCGMGSCSATGMTSCVAGVVQNSCHVGSPLPGGDSSCNAVDDDCDGQVDEGFEPAATSCGLGVCAHTGETSCVNGAVHDSCLPGAPSSDTDDSCNGLDDDCNDQTDEDFIEQSTSCGFGPICSSHGNTSCVDAQILDSCQVPCEGQCNDGEEDDADQLIDCADPDCENAVGCLLHSFGSSCSVNSDCNLVGSEGLCSVGFPGGYCTRPCLAGCPDGTVCLGGLACVVACGPGNHCGRAEFSCSSIIAPDVPEGLWCHPTCLLSCPVGTLCDPTTTLCLLTGPGLLESASHLPLF